MAIKKSEARLARHLRIESPIEVVQGGPLIEPGLVIPTLDEPGTAPVEFVLQDQ